MPSPDDAPRAALFSTRFLPYSQTFVFDELRYHQRYAVEVFCLERQNQQSFPYEPVHALKPVRGIVGQIEAFAYQKVLFSPRFGRLLAGGRFRIIHAHFGTGAQYALPYAARFGLPLVVTLHGFDVTALATSRRFHPKHWRYAALAPWLLRRTTRFLAASTELAELICRVGAPERSVHVWRLGVELPVLVPPQAEPRNVLMVGRFVEKKGFEYGLRAFGAVAKRYPESRLVIIGDGELEGSLRRLVDELGLRSQVEFAGVLPHARVLERLTQAAVLLAPSVTARTGDRESGLIVVKEAAARGIPAVASHHGGIPEIVEDGVSGYLVPERDVGGLAGRLDALLGDAALRLRIGTAARSRMEREYDIKTRVEELERHYDEAIDEHAARHSGRSGEVLP